MTDRAAELLRFAVEGREHEAVARWLGGALSALLCGEAADLGDALGLPGAALRDAGRAARNHWLREAAQLAAPDARPWAQVAALEAAERATRVARERARRLGLPPGDALAAALALAERFGAMPRTRRQLYAVVAAEIGPRCDFSGARRKVSAANPA